MGDINMGYAPQTGTWIVKHRNIMLRVTRVAEYVQRKQGFLVMTLARASLKDTSDPNLHAEPGHPPYSHRQGKAMGWLKRKLNYAPAPDNKSVIIGPERIYEPGKGKAPHTMEFGGPANIPIYNTVGGERKIVASYSSNLLPRPYMRPALNAAIPQLAEFWRNAIPAN